MQYTQFILLLVVLSCVVSCSQQDDRKAPDRTAATNTVAAETKVTPIEFPKDEGLHPDSPIEWWYLNTQLADANGKQYAFAYCKFSTGRHLVTFLDKSAGTAAGKDYYEEVTAAEGKLDLSSITGKWKETAPFTYHFYYSYQGLTLDFMLKARKKPFLPGGEGWIAMGEQGTSRYYALTDMTVNGTATMGTNAVKVSGRAWMDHQWGKWDWLKDFSQWKWYSVQLDNGVELMLFNIYKDKKLVNSHCGYIDPSNFQLHHLDAELITTKYYTDGSGGKWQKEVEIAIKELGDTRLRLISERDEQFMEPGVLWEGSMTVEGEFRRVPVKGLAFGELNRPD